MKRKTLHKYHYYGLMYWNVDCWEWHIEKWDYLCNARQSVKTQKAINPNSKWRIIKVTKTFRIAY